MRIKMVDKFKVSDFNKELEEVLEKKDFDVTVKNLLLSMLYKLENAYKDYSKVKVKVKEKDGIISEIIYIISEYCDKIDLVTPKTIESKELEVENKKYIIDIKKGYIKTYANEVSLITALYAMKFKVDKLKIENEDEEVNVLLKFYEEAMINDCSEIIRDFDGWSWNVNMQNNLEIMYNYIYQLIEILFGTENIKKIILKDSEFIKSLVISDRENLEDIYILIYTYMALNNMDIYEQINKKIIDKKEYLELVNDKDKFLDYITEEKKRLNKEIGNIDELTNNEEKLREEYFKRNSKLKNEEKIFSISYLEDMLLKERDEKINQIKESNNLLNPSEYIKLSEKLKEEFEFYDRLLQNIERTDVRKATIVKLQRNVLKKFAKDIESLEEKENIKNIIYGIRYFLLLKVNNKERVLDEEELKEDIKNTINMIIDIAIDKEVITNISDSTSICYNILRFIFESRNIDLEDLAVKLEHKKDDEKIIADIYDEQEIEKSFEIDYDKINLINIKMNKKVRLFC